MKREKVDVRVENLLVLILLGSLKGAKRGEKALQLSLAGFSNIEIANFLQTSAQVIANTLSEERRKKSKKVKDQKFK